MPGKPASFSMMIKSGIHIPVKNLEFIDTSYLLKEEKENSIPNRYGVIQHFTVDIKKEGIETKLEGKGTIWQYEIISGEAYSLGMRFSNFHIPEGASVFIYNEKHDQIAGAFTCIDNLENEQLPIADFKGKNAIIEYFEPLNASFPGELIIGSVALAYRKAFLNGIERIGINCPQGANWQDVKHSVCLMTFNDSLYLYYCSGFLINNVREDGTPYFQTASHCLNNNYMASTLVTFFNFEQPTCSVDSILFSPSIAGATMIASSSYSDFSLLKLSQFPPNSYMPYYAGWNAKIQYAKSGTCIHHPSRLPKCISYDTMPPRNYPFSINWQDTSATPISEPGTHWEVLFSRGSIENGSSGSPLFNENKEVIGQLHGGSSMDGFFGKFNLSWNYYNPRSKQLKYWLDPDSTGIMNLEGSYIPIKPRSSFISKYTDACNGATIKFKDFSKYAPKKWRWKISPGGYQYINGTDSTRANPEVVFKNEGKFSVSLITSNDFGSDTLTMPDYISSVYIHTRLLGIPGDNIVCGCDLTNYKVSATGAVSYAFGIERNDKITAVANKDSLFLNLKPEMKKYGSFNSWIRVTGMNRSCISSDSLTMQINMPVNDDIENAIQLHDGNNPPLTNFCASVEKNEPHPTENSCFSQNSWCAEGVNPEQLLNHSIWFWFNAPSIGMITIDTRGLNNKIAIYEADSANQIISGNSQSYKIIAANDNRSVMDSTAYLSNIKLQPYKTYWLQAEGDNQETGYFSIQLMGNSVEVMPNPSSGAFKITFLSMEAGMADVQVITSAGIVVFSGRFNVSPDSNQFEINLSGLARGMYYLNSRINGNISRAKLLLIN